jgi:CDP-glycerol glycerophosphotransferase
MSKWTKIKNNPLRFFKDAKLNPYWLFHDRDLEGAANLHAAKYLKFYESIKTCPFSILYESYHGTSISCNPYAIFKYLINQENYENYTHYWVVKKGTYIPQECLNVPNVKFIILNSKEYCEKLSSCKYLINNTTFPDYFIRKTDQFYLNTWHGIPLKTLGKDMKGKIRQYKNIQRNFLQSTHILSPNKYTTEKLLVAHDIDGLYPGEIIEGGYPRWELSLTACKQELWEFLNLNSEKNVILYAPTWRGELGSINAEKDDTIKKIKELSALLSNEFELIVKTHYLVSTDLKNLNLGCYLVDSKVDSNELLSIVDILITDYSSILFDFILLDKPLIIFADDEDDYKSNRGLYFELDRIPAKLCRDIVDVADSVRDTDWHKKLRLDIINFKQRFLEFGSHNACKLVVDNFFNSCEKSQQSDSLNKKENILFYAGGFRNNGITTSIINLLKNIDYNRYNVVIAEGANYHFEKEINFKQIDERVKIFVRCGNLNLSKNERKCLNRLYTTGKVDSNNDELKHMFLRERQRLFGDVNFHVVIDFSGYVKYWTLLFVFGGFERKVIYQHNDMLSESLKKIGGKYKHKSNLNVIFCLYKYFDKIISVSEQTKELNLNNIGELVPNANCKFDYVNNAIDFKGLLTASKDSIESDDGTFFGGKVSKESDFVWNGKHLLSNSRLKFIHIGRFSPEKRHDKLLKAFKKVCEIYPDSLLFLVGSGPLITQVMLHVEQFKLTNNVVLTGQLKNPHSLLARCDCLVMSSDHEGQPMVLLEAMILNKPIISTDIAGTRGVLKNYYGHLVPNDVEGLYNGMKDFSDNLLIFNRFDYKTYQENAIARFNSVVCGRNG